MMRDHLLGYAPAANVEEAAPFYGLWPEDDYPLGVPLRVTTEYRKRRLDFVNGLIETNKPLEDFERKVHPYPDGTLPPPAFATNGGAQALPVELARISSAGIVSVTQQAEAEKKIAQAYARANTYMGCGG